MNVNFEYYKIFYYVAKYQNFTKAAQALQPAEHYTGDELSGTAIKLYIVCANKSWSTVDSRGRKAFYLCICCNVTTVGSGRRIG